MLVATRSCTGDAGNLDVSVDGGDGHVPVGDPGAYQVLSRVVLDGCYSAPVAVQVRNSSTNGWVGSVLYSTDTGGLLLAIHLRRLRQRVEAEGPRDRRRGRARRERDTNSTTVSADEVIIIYQMHKNVWVKQYRIFSCFTASNLASNFFDLAPYGISRPDCASRLTTPAACVAKPTERLKRWAR